MKFTPSIAAAIMAVINLTNAGVISKELSDFKVESKCDELSCNGVDGVKHCHGICGGACNTSGHCIRQPVLAGQGQFDCYEVTCIGGSTGDETCAQACGGVCDPVASRCVQRNLFTRQEGFGYVCYEVTCISHMFGNPNYGDELCASACGGKCHPVHNKCYK